MERIRRERPEYLDPAALAKATANGEARLEKRIRRVRVCQCPHCLATVPLDPVRDGCALTMCAVCYLVFGNGEVTSWLEDPLWRS